MSKIHEVFVVRPVGAGRAQRYKKKILVVHILTQFRWSNIKASETKSKKRLFPSKLDQFCCSTFKFVFLMIYQSRVTFWEIADWR